MNRIRFSPAYTSDDLVECHKCNSMVAKKKAFIPGWMSELVYECQICPTEKKYEAMVSTESSELITCEKCLQQKSRFTADFVDGKCVCKECIGSTHHTTQPPTCKYCKQNSKEEFCDDCISGANSDDEKNMSELKD